MRLSLPKRGRLFEFAVVVGLLGTIALFLLGALKTLQDDSERLSVELTVRNMNTGLYLIQAERIAAGREDTLQEIALANPVSWLASPPVGYIGEQPCAKILAEGQWCWDKALQTLYYLPRQAKWLKNGGNVPWFTWRVPVRQHGNSYRPGGIRLQMVVEPEPNGK